MARKTAISSAQVWIRVVLLVGGFVGVLYSMKSIRNNKTLDAFFSSQGASSGTSITRGILSLCPTRVSQIEVIDHRNNKKLKFYQSSSKWMVEAEATVELEPLFMEKWLAEFCEVHIDTFLESPPSDAALQEITFKYVDDTTQSLKVYGQGFSTELGLVLSQELEKAITRLNH